MTNETQQVEISAGHTPGPWRIERRDGQAHGFGIYHGINTFVVSPHTGVIDESDAHLIAAAPDLLEALEAMRRMIDRAHEDGILTLGNLPRDYTLIERSADAAIRKARGEGGASEP